MVVVLKSWFEKLDKFLINEEVTIICLGMVTLSAKYLYKPLLLPQTPYIFSFTLLWWCLLITYFVCYFIVLIFRDDYLWILKKN